MKKLSTIQLRQVLEAAAQNLSYRQIAQRTGVSKSSIGRTLDFVNRSGCLVSDFLKFDDNQLFNAFYPPERQRRLEPDWEQIHKQSKRKGITLRFLFERYTAETAGRTYNYASFCRRVQIWKQENGLITVGGNVERIPGERMEVDFVGDRLEWIDTKGENRSSRLFVATLPYSCIIFAEAFDDESQISWINGIVDALEYFGAVPEVLIMDNAKALLKQDGWREGEAQAAIRSLCLYYGMQPWACKPRTPKQKNRVEAAAGDLERWLIAELTHEQNLIALNLRDLNAQLVVRLDAINRQLFKGRYAKNSRRSVFEQEELQCMRPLPARSYEPGDWKLLTVDKAHCVRIASEGGHRYSTPASYIGKTVAVRIARDTVEIYDPQTMSSLGTHPRCTDRRGSKTHILPQHLTAAEKHYRRTAAEWTDMLVSKGLPKQLSLELIASLRAGKGNFPSARICGAICGLFRTFPAQTIRQAVAAALEDNSVSFRYIKQLCEQFQFARTTNRELDFEGNGGTPPVSPSHNNIRNNYK